MTTDRDIAAAMYPDLAAASAKPAAATPVPAKGKTQSVADALYAAPKPAAKPDAQQAAPKPEEADATAARMYAADGGRLPDPPALNTRVTVDDLVNREQSSADALYAAGGPVPEAPEGYNTELGGAFDRLEFEARYDQDEADIAALAEGRKQTATYLHELAVPAHEAGEISRTLADWQQRPALDEGSLLDGKGSAIQQLEREWGKEAAARIELAQRTAKEACKRLPWLADLLARGAGNDPALIKRFAEIGLRSARRTKK